MARKATYPAPYELMRTRGKGAPEAPKRPPPTAAPGWLSAGRTIRLPIGYILLAAALALAGFIGTFSVGYARGQRDTRGDYERDWLARVVIPPPERGVPTHGPKVASPGKAPGPAEAPSPPGWGVILSDPRQAGNNYFVLIHTRREAAIQLARFCRDREVEAYVVKANNVSLYRVIALPGYRKGERSSEAVLSLERRIVEVARKWKLQVNPRDDLAYYPEKYDG